jgi:methionine biosynthesis protein MetW
LELGGRIEEVTVAYETYGRLNKERDNAIFVCHALSGDSHIARHDPEDDPGWWDIMVGPGKAIDTDRYFVVCPNAMGGCRGTTGPNSLNPKTGRRYGADFPTITATDIDVEDDDLYVHSPASIFGALRRPRIDYDQIVKLIRPSASVLDLGCGRGSLLVKLRRLGARNLMGLELNEDDMLYCLQRGLDVVQADLNDGLEPFSDSQFDYVVLSHTLQAVRDVELLIADMLRVGGRSIVSFPNFAYHKLRKVLGEQGRSPVSSGLLRHEWYNTPNIRFFTIADFEEFCLKRNIRVHERIALDTEGGRVVTEDFNLLADMAIFVISK